MQEWSTEFWNRAAPIEDAVAVMRHRLEGLSMLGVSFYTPPCGRPHALVSGVEAMGRLLKQPLPRRVQMTPVGSDGFIRSIEAGARGYAVVIGSEGLPEVAGATRIACMIRDELMRGEPEMFLIRPPNQTGVVRSWALRPGGVWRPMGDGFLAEVRVGAGTPSVLWGRTSDGDLVYLPREYAAPGMVALRYWEPVRGAPEDLVALPHRTYNPCFVSLSTAGGIIYADLTRIHEGVVRVVGEEPAPGVRVVGDITDAAALVEEWPDDAGGRPIQKIVPVDRSHALPRYTLYEHEPHERPRAGTPARSEEISAS